RPLIFLMIRRPPRSQPFPYTTLFRSDMREVERADEERDGELIEGSGNALPAVGAWRIDSGEVDHSIEGILHLHLQHAGPLVRLLDRKSTRLNSSHRTISYAVFCLKKK